MGYNSVIFMCNDAMDQVTKDPVGWWQRTREKLMTFGRKDHDDTYGWGYHANGFQAVSNRHADEVVLIAAGGNFATVIGSVYNSGMNHNKKEQQIQLLEEILERLRKEK